MPSLLQVLHEASSRAASEVVLEAGQAPRLRTATGPVSVGSPLTDAELFEALAQVLGPDQQAALAVGNVVEFELVGDAGTWRLVTEPAEDGMVVRGRIHLQAEAAAAGPSLDLPKLDPVEPKKAPEVPSARSPLQGGKKRQTQWDIGVSAAPGPDRGVSSAPVSTPSWSRKLEGREGESDFEIRPPPQAAPSLPDDGVSPPMGRRASGVSWAPGTGPMRAVQVEEFASAVAPGSIWLVQGTGFGEDLVSGVHAGELAVIDESADVHNALREAAARGPGGRFVLRVEDPSACLGWILRRAEEGARVVVEVRARTALGARRVLLGLSASARAEAWLAVHPLYWVCADDEGWARHAFEGSKLAVALS